MTPQELAAIIEVLILDADAKYAKTLQRFQNRLYNDLALVLKDLELTDGYITQSTSNRRILTQATNLIDEAYTSPTYTLAVSNYVAIVPRIDAANISYFTSLETGFTPKKIYLRSLQKELITTVNQYVLQDGLQSQVIQPLNQIMNQNVNAGGSYSGFIDQVREYVKGSPEVEGKAMKYTRTFVKDTLFTYSRTYQQAVTTDLGLTYFYYSGSLMDTSREFCVERFDQYYSKKEIEAWASLEWKGKKQGTTESSIFHFAGGWNCGHQIIPVSEVIVPKIVKDRQ